MAPPNVKPPYTAKVYPIGRPSIILEGLQAFLEDHTLRDLPWSDDNEQPGDQLAEVAARLDYWSFPVWSRRPGGAVAYFDHILHEQHTNVIEVPHWQFIVRCSQGVARELLRYRTAERSQTSTRFVDYSAVPMMIGPGHSADPDEGWRDAYRAAYRAGTIQAVDLGLVGTAAVKYARSIAAEAIPFGAMTWVMLAMNGQTARHLLLQRMTSQAHPEIREIATQLYAIFQAEAPHIMRDLSVDSEGNLHRQSDYPPVAGAKR